MPSQVQRKSFSPVVAVIVTLLLVCAVAAGLIDWRLAAEIANKLVVSSNVIEIAGIAIASTFVLCGIGVASIEVRRTRRASVPNIEEAKPLLTVTNADHHPKSPINTTDMQKKLGGSRLSVSPANAEGLEEIPVVRYKAIFDAKYRSLSGLLNQFSNVQNKLELLQQLKQELVQELDKFCRQYQDNQSLKALAPTYPHPLNSSQQISLADLIEFYIKETEATLENHADNDNNAGSSRSLGQRSDVEEEDPDVYSPKGTFD